MKTRWSVGALLVAALLALPSVLADDTKEKKEDKDKVDLKKIMCPVGGGKVNPKVTAKHNGGEIMFCCEKCVKAFAKDKDNEKFLAKANYQLVATRQAKQAKCPFSGGKVNKETAIKVGYAKLDVGFCCGNCQKKAKETKEDKLIAMLFGKKGFDKGFKVAKKDDKKEKQEDKDKEAES